MKVQEKKKKVVVFCSRPRQIAKLGSSVHVVVVQQRQRNVQKSVMNEQSCCFANISLLVFCRSRCRRRRCINSLL